MKAFLVSQLDFVFFVYGAAFLLLAITCRLLMRADRMAMPWVWLFAFAALHGVNEWLDLAALSIADGVAFTAVRTIVLAASFMALVEFAAEAARRSMGLRIPRWTPLVLLACAATGLAYGLPGANAAARYCLGVPGAMGTALVLWVYIRQDRANRSMLWPGVLAMGAYAVASGLVVPRAGFLPASVVNHQAFLQALGFPVQLLRGALAVIVAMSAWQYYRSVRRRAFPQEQHAGLGWLTISIVAVVPIGWGFTEMVGREYRDREYGGLLDLARAASVSTNWRRVDALSGTADDVARPDYQRLREVLRLLRDEWASEGIRRCSMLTRRGSALIVISDTQWHVSPRPADAWAYPAPLMAAVEDVLAGGPPAVVGPFDREGAPSVCAVVAVRDPEKGRVSAVVVVESDAARLDATIRLERLEPITILMLVMGVTVGWFWLRQKDIEHHAGLAESEDRLRGVATSAVEAVIVVEDDGTIGLWNPAAESLFETPADAVVGRQAKSVLSPLGTIPRGADAWTTIESHARSPRAGAALEMSCRQAGGRDVPLEVTCTLIHRRRGNQVLIMCRDVSERHALEAERTRSHEVAEAANRAKSVFLSRMSHEIRTPMNAIIGYCDLLTDTPLDAAQSDYARTIREGAAALIVVINDVLDFSKVEAGQLTLDARPFDLRDAIGTVVRLLSLRASQKGIEFRCDVDPELPLALVGDPDRLRQVILNLVGNAMKFTDRGSVTVRARVIRHAERVCHFAIEVTDTGIGMSPQAVGRLFQRFVQVDPVAARRASGTGLGLAISKQLVELMRGRVEVVSREGQGSTFTVYLAMPVATERVKSSVEAAPPQPRDRGQIRVLVAEDNAVNRRLAEIVLTKLGYVVHLAEDGRQAVEFLSANTVDVVLMDIEMPVMDGIEATRAIRAMAQPGRDVPIVALSAHAMRGDSERFVAAGMDDYIPKPLDIHQLDRTLQKWAGGRGR